MAQDLNEALDALAAQAGFRYTPSLLDAITPASGMVVRKAAELKQFLEARKLAAGEQAKSDLLSGAALTGANATPSELAAFKPGLPFDRSVRPEPTPGLPEGTPDPALEADLQTQLRDEELNRAATKNAPALESMRRSLALHNAGLNEAAIAQARVSGQHERLYGATADIAVARRDALTNILNDPALDPMLKNEIAQNKISFKSQRVKVQHKDGTVGYYDATPNLSGGYDYAQATDENGDPISAPVGDRSTALQKNAAFLARVLYGNEPDAEQKAVTMLTQLKTKSPRDAWASLTMAVSKLGFGKYERDPQKLHDKTVEMWRVARPGEPIPTEAPMAPAPPAAPGGQPAAAPAPGVPSTTQRKAGTVYQTPRGPMTWTGTGWLPPPFRN